jgi:FixJ family two-component response regulator
MMTVLRGPGLRFGSEGPRGHRMPPEAPSRGTERSSGWEGLGEGHAIAIVDDDRLVRRSVGRLIEAAGFRVKAYASAEAFLRSADLRTTACLILDVRLSGMNGLELQRQLAAAQARVPIIFMTAHSDEETRARALEAGAVGFLYKPFREEALLEAIRAALER